MNKIVGVLVLLLLFGCDHRAKFSEIASKPGEGYLDANAKKAVASQS